MTFLSPWTNDPANRLTPGRRIFDDALTIGEAIDLEARCEVYLHTGPPDDSKILDCWYGFSRGQAVVDRLGMN